MTLGEAARVTGGRVQGSEATAFSRISPIRDADPGDLAFLADRRYASFLPDCTADALLVSESLAGLAGGPENRLIVDDAHVALLTLLPALYTEDDPPHEGVHPTALVDPSADLGEGLMIGANVVVGRNCVIGRGVRIGANTVIGEAVEIGDESRVFPNVTIYPNATLGRRVIVHAGTRIGADGFGYVRREGQHLKVPQVGECVIEDDVEIGANCTIDRGSIGRTVIGAGSKLDNLVHVAHNVVIGPRSLLVAQVGIAGSTRTGEDVVFGGQAGIVGHLTIGAGARIGAQAGVIGDVAPGDVVSGYPARRHSRFLRAMATLMRLPDVVKRLERLEGAVGESARTAGGDRQEKN